MISSIYSQIQCLRVELSRHTHTVSWCAHKNRHIIFSVSDAIASSVERAKRRNKTILTATSFIYLISKFN